MRLGLIAASRIADLAVVQPARQLDRVEVTAVAARSGERARAAAERWGVPLWFGSYEALLACDDVDAVYVATPNSLHRPWAIAALDAGKHVLVEKPLAANTADATQLADAADDSDLVVMEAFHWRYHPLVAQMQDILDSGMLGSIERVEGRFEVGAGRIPLDDIRYVLGLGGGAMMDIGVYPAGWLIWVMGGVPDVVSAHATCPVPDVDGRIEAEVEWSTGVRGFLVGSMMGPAEETVASLEVHGSDGAMLVGNPVHPQNGATLAVKTEAGATNYPVVGDTTYHHQLKAFRDAIELGSPFPTTAREGVRTMELIDACYRAAGLEPRPSLP